jgi:hypothetical protein
MRDGGEKGSYADVVQIDLVLLMKQTASHAKL